MIYVWTSLAGLGLSAWLAGRVRREFRGPGGRHRVRRGSLRFGTAREILRHRRFARVRTWADTIRANAITVAHHELTARTTRYWVRTLLTEMTVEIPRSQLERS